jgi:hypothetical protein
MIDHLAVSSSGRTRQWSVGTRTRTAETVNIYVPASDGAVEGADDVVLLLSVAPVPDVRPQVVEPPEPAALAAAVQPWIKTEGKKEL